MSQSTIIKIQTLFTTIEHQTGSRELASLFDLFLRPNEDQRKLIFVGENPKQVEEVRLALMSYSGAFPENKTNQFMYDLVREAIYDYKELVIHCKDGGQEPPKFNFVVEVTLTT